MLNVDCLHLGHPVLHRRLGELPTCAELTDRTGLLEFPLELLERLLDVFAFFYRYYDLG